MTGVNFNIDVAKDQDFTDETKNYTVSILTQDVSLDLIWKSMTSCYLIDYIDFDWANIIKFVITNEKSIQPRIGTFKRYLSFK